MGLRFLELRNNVSTVTRFSIWSANGAKDWLGPRPMGLSHASLALKIHPFKGFDSWAWPSLEKNCTFICSLMWENFVLAFLISKLKVLLCVESIGWGGASEEVKLACRRSSALAESPLFTGWCALDSLAAWGRTLPFVLSHLCSAFFCAMGLLRLENHG